MPNGIISSPRAPEWTTVSEYNRRPRQRRKHRRDLRTLSGTVCRIDGAGAGGQGQPAQRGCGGNARATGSTSRRRSAAAIDLRSGSRPALNLCAAGAALARPLSAGVARRLALDQRCRARRRAQRARTRARRHGTAGACDGRLGIPSPSTPSARNPRGCALLPAQGFRRAYASRPTPSRRRHREVFHPHGGCVAPCRSRDVGAALLSRFCC